MRRLRFKELGIPPHRPHLAITHLKGPCATVPHTHDFFELFLVLSGESLHHLNRRKTPLAAGQLVTVLPEDAHWYSVAPGKTLRIINLAVSSSWMRAFRALTGSSLPDEASRERRLGPRARLALEHSLLRSGHDDDPLVLMQGWSHALRLLREETPLLQDAAIPEWLEAFRRELFEKSADLTQTIRFWQRRSGRTPEHLARSCRRYYGVTPSELVNLARVERARYLLRTSEEKVITIAFESGFANLAHFYRVFNRVTGQTPSDWRRKKTATVPV